MSNTLTFVRTNYIVPFQCDKCKEEFSLMYRNKYEEQNCEHCFLRKYKIAKEYKINGWLDKVTVTKRDRLVSTKSAASR